MSTSVYVADKEDDRTLIDSFRPGITGQSGHVEQFDRPGENPMAYSESRGYSLPSVLPGAQIGSGNRLGWSNGYFGPWLRRMRFTGRVWTGGQDVQANPVQGNVSRGTHQQQLYAGVRQQLAQYDGTLTTQALSVVGQVAGGSQ